MQVDNDARKRKRWMYAALLAALVVATLFATPSAAQSYRADICDRRHAKRSLKIMLAALERRRDADLRHVDAARSRARWSADHANAFSTRSAAAGA